ncbi:hypothetical protein BDR06DRAFT_1015085 [Suillus hirtellus]|nr:hypothetical protein BDR06DRAFT_1015085 [Suillus hirtellus]
MATRLITEERYSVRDFVVVQESRCAVERFPRQSNNQHHREPDVLDPWIRAIEASGFLWLDWVEGRQILSRKQMESGVYQIALVLVRNRDDVGSGVFVTAGQAAYEQLKNPEKKDDEKKHRADARTAPRAMLVHGMPYGISRPNDEALIWEGDLRWCQSDGSEPSCGEFDWLVDYLERNANTDDETFCLH